MIDPSHIEESADDKMSELLKWRLMLGGDEADGTDVALSPEDQAIDDALAALYEYEQRGTFEYGEKGKGGGAKSSPTVSRWLGDIRKYFKDSVVEVMQGDALKHPELKKRMIFDPEVLDQTTADVHMVASLIEMGKMIPEETKETARKVVRKVVDQLLDKLEHKMVSAINGALDRSSVNRRPKLKDIDWHTTIRKNLKHYQPDYKTVIPEIRVGFGRKNRKSLKDVVICLDQSGSMGTSVVYSGIFGSVMASLPAVTTKMIVFDTEVVDLTEDLQDPVDILFGVQLGGGTDINHALKHCQTVITKPSDTVLVLVTDLYEGGNEEQMLLRMRDIVESGVTVVCLLALSDDGSPSYDAENANRLYSLGVPVFACTPDLFPDLMAAAISKADLMDWLGRRDIVVRH